MLRRGTRTDQSHDTVGERSVQLSNHLVSAGNSPVQGK